MAIYLPEDCEKTGYFCLDRLIYYTVSETQLSKLLVIATDLAETAT